MKTQKQIEKETGLLQPHISKYLSGVLLPTYPVAKKLSIALNMSVDELYEMILSKKKKRKNNK